MSLSEPSNHLKSFRIMEIIEIIRNRPTRGNGTGRCPGLFPRLRPSPGVRPFFAAAQCAILVEPAQSSPNPIMSQLGSSRGLGPRQACADCAVMCHYVSARRCSNLYPIESHRMTIIAESHHLCVRVHRTLALPFKRRGNIPSASFISMAHVLALVIKRRVPVLQHFAIGLGASHICQERSMVRVCAGLVHAA